MQSCGELFICPDALKDNKNECCIIKAGSRNSLEGSYPGMCYPASGCSGGWTDEGMHTRCKSISLPLVLCCRQCFCPLKEVDDVCSDKDWGKKA